MMAEPGITGLRAHIVVRLRREGRRLLEGLERRRAEAVRRAPARLVRRLGRARNVLVLCQGNVIRSVFAAHLLAASLKGKRSVSIASAGLATTPGWRAHPRVIARCADLGIDLSGRSSVLVTETMMKAADVVLVMEVSQLVVVSRGFFRARWRTFLLTCLAPEVPMDIEDPVGKDDAAVEACLDHIARVLKPLVAAITERDTAVA